MSKLGTICAAFAVVGLATLPVANLSAADVEAKVLAINVGNHTVTVSSSVIEPDGTAVVKVNKVPDNMKVGDPVVVTWKKEFSGFVLIDRRK